VAGNVIDSLVVTLGLESKGFAEGIKGSTEQLAGFTRRLAGLFLAVRGFEDVVGYFKDLHHTLAEIGFTSRNLGVAGTELKRLGEVSELFGGQMQDAADSVQSLQAGVFNLKYRGQLSDSLLMLQRFGVAYLDAAGHARKFRDIAADAAKVIDRQRARGADQGELTQLAQSMGFTGGIASAVAQGSAGFEKAFSQATKDQKPLSERTIAAQVQLSRDLTRQSERLQALNSNILARLTPVIEHATQWLMKLANDLLPKLVKTLDSLIAFFKNPPPWFKAIENAAAGIAGLLGPIGTLTAAILGLGALLGVGGALVSTLTSLPVLLGVGLGAAIAGLKSGGLLDKLDEKFLDWFGPGSSAAEREAIRSTPGAGTRPALPRPPATPTAPRPPSAAEQSAAPAGTPTAMLTGGGTHVQIDEINVETRATDANGIAGSIGGALRRKLLVANADNGLA
jgi:hypothetical protein